MAVQLERLRVADDEIHALDAESARDVAIVTCYQDAFPSGAD
jgi:hypothetical protein